MADIEQLRKWERALRLIVEEIEQANSSAPKRSANGSRMSSTPSTRTETTMSEHDTTTPEGAFLAENPYASQAAAMVASVVDGPRDPRDPGVAAYMVAANTLATLAVAYEQRLSRFDLAVELQSHARRTEAFDA